MFNSAKNFWNGSTRKQLTDARNIGLYVFGVIVLAISWSGVKTVQTNYQLQKQISALRQQNEVVNLKNLNSSLQNQYFQSDEYLDLAARQDLGLAAPGEQVLLVPQAVAMKYVDPSLAGTYGSLNPGVATDNRSKIAKNLEDWRDFLLGRKLFSD